MENFVIELSPEEEVVRSVIEPIMVSEGFELVQIQLKAVPGKLALRLFIDIHGKKNGVVMDNLVDISRMLSDVLDASFDEKSVLKRRYDLEVSSPGLDRPLTKISHFKDAVNEKIKLRFKNIAIKGCLGQLIEADDEGIVIEPEGSKDEKMTVSYKDIALAHIVFTFPKNEKK